MKQKKLKKSTPFKIFASVIVSALLFCAVCAGWLYFDYKKNYPVDLVVPWVDSADREWLTKKSVWQQQYTNLPLNAIDESRFRQNDELKYMLRSVEKNLPWIRKIFLVTDHQVPSWLKLNHPKLTIVSHEDIFPHDALPVFSSAAIEARLPYIPALSEHFLFANDDTFVSTPLPKSYFFDENRNPKVYVRFKKRTHDSNLWLAQIKKAHELVAQKYPLNFVITPSHNIQPYRKSYFSETIQEYPEEFHQTTYSKFRQADDMNRIIVDLTDRMKKRNTFISENNTSDLPPACHWPFLLVSNNFDDLVTFEPCLFCLNDFEGKSQNAIETTKSILKYLWPEKSSFEK